MLATAAAVVIITAVAIVVADTAECFAAGRALYIIKINGIVEAYRLAAVGAFYLYAVAVVVTAVAIVIVIKTILFCAILAFAIVAFVAVKFIFERAEILVNLFDVLFKILGLVVKVGNRSGKVREKIEYSRENLIVLVCLKSCYETLYISNFFGKCHNKYSFIKNIVCNYFVFTLSRYSPVLVSMRRISPFSMKSGT